MKKIYFSILAAFFFVTGSFAQTVVVAGADAITLAGNPYTTLKAAFDNINAASQTGNIIAITVTGTTTETATAALNAGTWTSVTIVPVGISAITGNIAGPLVDFNGADNVTINGLDAGILSLSINNSNTTATASTVRFIGDATSNTIRQCNLLGASTGLGTVFFSTAAITGNDNNTIDQCVVTASGGNTPLNGIYAAGSAGFDNSGISITLNNISDYFNAAAAASGINIGASNTGWTITGNRLYQGSTRTTTAAGITHTGITVSSGASYTISNNIIGFANVSGTGTTNMIGLSAGALGGTFPSAFTVGGTAANTRYIAINCAFTAAGLASSIQNNTIGGFALYSSSNANTGYGVLCGIQVTSGNANIGTVTGNTIGAGSGQDAIYVASTTAGAVVSGIYVSSTNTVNIQNNTIGAINVSGTSATTAAGFKGIDAAGTGTYSITGNTIGNATPNNIRTGYLLSGANLSNTPTTPTTAAGISSLQGIVGTPSGTASIVINGNTVQGLQMSGSVTTFFGIQSNGNASGASITINNNTLGTVAAGLLSIPFANSAGILCINNTTGNATTTLTINNNIFQGMSYGAEGSGSFRCINNSALMLSSTMNNNNFNNLTVNTSAQTFGFLIGATNNTPTVLIDGNFVTTQFTNATTTGASNLLAIANSGATSATGSSTITNNNLSNITYRCTTSFGSAIYWLNGNIGGSTHNINISNNTIANFTNVGTATTTGAYALYAGYGNTNVIANNSVSGVTSTGQTIAIVAATASLNATGSFTVNNNTIFNIVSASPTSQAQGMQCAAGPTQNIFKNKIYDISNSSTGSVIGLIQTSATAGTVANIYNNYIGRLYAPTSTVATAVRAITFGSTVFTTANVYYNTVYIDGNCPTSSFCILMPGTTPVFNIRNNIFVNNATATGSLQQFGVFVTGSLTPQYAPSSNNNLIYAGTPGPLHLIYGDGAVGTVTNAQTTLAGFKAFVGPVRENMSVTELPPFLSTVGASASFLHISTAIPTQVESGAVNIAGYTDDFDNDIRQGNPGYAGSSVLGPDIGADEGNFVFADVTAPLITSIVFTTNACNLTSRTVTANISDVTGVNNAGFQPRIYFRKNGGAYVSVAGTLTSGTVNNGTWTFTINYALVGGVVAADLIEYFIVAQDVAVPANAGGNPSAGLVLTDVNTVTTPPTTPLAYTITTSMSGTYLVGTGQVSPNYATLTAAIADYNTRCLSGPIVFELQDALYGAAETFPISILNNSDASAINTLTISPKAATASVISFGNATSLFELNGTRYVRFDGLNAGGASLLVRNTTNTAPAMRLQNDAVFNTITRTTFETANTTFNTTGSGAVMLLTSTGTLGNSNNTFSFCDFRDRTDVAGTPRILIESYGSTSPQNINNSITNCNFYNAYQNGFTAYGIYLGLGTSDWTISNNSFYQTNTKTSTLTGTTLYGIYTSNPTANNLQITGNYFGGTAPLCAGTALTLTTATAGVGNTILPVYMSVAGTAVATNIQNNTFQNIALTSAPAAGANAFPFSPISAVTGSYIVDGNTIGAGTGNGSITVNNNGAQTATNFFFVEAMEFSPTGSIAVTNNTIGSYNLGGTNTAALTAFRGILLTGNPTSATLSGNQFGSSVTANSIQNTVTTRNAPFFCVLASVASGITINVTNNTFRNITNLSTSTNANNYFTGLNFAGTTPFNASGNIFSELSTASGATSTVPGSNAMTAIFNSSTGSGHVISGNTISGLRATSASAVVSVYGIGNTGSGSTGSIAKNRIYDLTNISTGAGSRIYGTMSYIGSNWTYSNNMVSLTNASNTNAVDIQGMHEEMTTGAIANYYYNSVQVGGTAATGSTNSYAFNRSLPTTVSLRNNIFSNIRTGGTGFHVAIANTSTTVGWPATASDYNDLYASTPSTLTQWLGSAAINNLPFSGWIAAQPAGSGGDANSVTVMPVFTAAATADLHLTASDNCALDGRATPVAVTSDFDNQTRDVTVPDIGADEFVPTFITTLYNTTSTTTCDTRVVAPAGTTFRSNVCNPFARVVPSGASPVIGTVNTCVYIDPATNPTFNAEPYVQRHFDIEPATAASTATATVTLYFTDAEFVTFNANNAAFPDLPTVAGGGNADPNIGNVRITQYHGTPTTSPSSPGNYTVAGGAGVRINPASITTTYNGNYWEVTFPVTGFSGFYLHTNVSYALPITMNYFRGSRQGSNHLLNWKVTCNSTPKATLVLERSAHANGPFNAINTIDATAARCNQPFDYTDTHPLAGMNYYRLKMIDADGKITYSGIVALLNATKGFAIVGIAPNPVVNGSFKLNVTSANAGKMDVVISDMQGRIVQRSNVALNAGFSSLDMNVNNLASGTYNLVGMTAEGKSVTIRFVKK